MTFINWRLVELNLLFFEASRPGNQCLRNKRTARMRRVKKYCWNLRVGDRRQSSLRSMCGELRSVAALVF
jgi:hypothetical protein